MVHVPVFKKEIIECFDPEPNKNFVDCTFGEGGHTFALLEMTEPNGKVLAIEADPELYKKFQTAKLSIINNQLLDRLILINDSYSNLKNIVEQNSFKPVNGILFDLGLSSWHFEESGRGFSFQKDEFLDMRYNPNENPLAASQIVASCQRRELEDILKEFGEERFAKRIAREIVKQREKRPIATTLDLVKTIETAVPSWYKRARIHPATKTFQALRIAVNGEIDNLKKGLTQAVEVLEKDGCIAVISFHSLEDRVVKHFFRRGQEINILKVLTKKPIVPKEEEILQNPRSRSAKLRVAQKIL